MAEQRSLVDHALELLVYAPVGLALSAIEELPVLIDKGRARLGGQVSNARVLGTFAVNQGQRQAQRVVSEAAGRLFHRAPPTGAPEPDGAATDARGRVTDVHADLAPDEAAVAESPQDRLHDRSEGAPSASGLAIPGYDSLSASHVVKRLAGLTADELDAVGRYEAASRRRKTVLHRVAQLQAGHTP